jgi:hypothetical protein
VIAGEKAVFELLCFFHTFSPAKLLGGEKYFPSLLKHISCPSPHSF